MPDELARVGVLAYALKVRLRGWRDGGKRITALSGQRAPPGQGPWLCTPASLAEIASAGLRWRAIPSWAVQTSCCSIGARRGRSLALGFKDYPAEMRRRARL